MGTSFRGFASFVSVMSEAALLGIIVIVRMLGPYLGVQDGLGPIGFIAWSVTTCMNSYFAGHRRLRFDHQTNHASKVDMREDCISIIAAYSSWPIC